MVARNIQLEHARQKAGMNGRNARSLLEFALKRFRRSDTPTLARRMLITEFLKPEAVVLELNAQSKIQVLERLAQALAASNPSITAQRFLSVLAEREKLVSTGLEKGIAIPHGRLSEMPHLTACLALSRSGIPFDALDGKPTHFFFALVAPESSAGIHLKALSKINRLFRSEALKSALLAASSPDEALRLIRDEDLKT